MTREEAIKVLNMVEAHGLADEAKRMAIEALSGCHQNDDNLNITNGTDAKEALTTILKNDVIKERNDVVEVVRCKDCHYAVIDDLFYEDDTTHMFCMYFLHKVHENDYCSNAIERREESEVE